MATTTRTRSTSTTKTAPARRRAPRATAPKASSVTADVKKVATSARTRAKRVAKSIPTDTRTLTIAGIIAGAIGAGVALFLGRDKVRSVASTSGEKIKKVADDLSTIAHEKIDLARDNITKFRGRSNAPQATDNEGNEAPFAAIG